MEKINVKILIVDDHAIVRDGVKTMLELDEFNCHNFTVLEASDEEETMSMLKSRAIDLVLMDYQLEKINGSSLTGVILNEYPEQLVLALSNYDDIEFTSSMLKSGARGYITKNVGSSELFEAITTVLSGKLFYTQHIANELIERKILKKGLTKKNSDSPAMALLSKREIEIIQLICEQLTNEEISKKLFLSKRTIDNHRQNILNKLGMVNTAGMVRFAVENGLLY